MAYMDVEAYKAKIEERQRRREERARHNAPPARGGGVGVTEGSSRLVSVRLGALPDGRVRLRLYEIGDDGKRVLLAPRSGAGAPT